MNPSAFVSNHLPIDRLIVTGHRPHHQNNSPSLTRVSSNSQDPLLCFRRFAIDADGDDLDFVIDMDVEGVFFNIIGHF